MRRVPADEILRYAEENGIDLIALGTHGRNGPANFIMGSVVEKLIRAAPCPVVIARGSMTQLQDDPAAAVESDAADELPPPP